MQDTIGTWSIRGTVTVSAATPKTAVQYAASSTNTAEVLAFNISQSGSTTSAMDRVMLIRKSAGATVTAGATGTSVYDWSGGAGTFRGTLGTAATGINASAEGTDTDIPWSFAFNTLAGYEWNAQPDMRLWVPVSGIVALKISAIVAATYDVI